MVALDYFHHRVLLAFQQNETAIDVARRKEHAEIILAITSQPKVRYHAQPNVRTAQPNVRTHIAT